MNVTVKTSSSMQVQSKVQVRPSPQVQVQSQSQPSSSTASIKVVGDDKVVNDNKVDGDNDAPLLSVRNLHKSFDLSGGVLSQWRWRRGRVVRMRARVHALNDVSFSVQAGEALCVVGESGCGKTTLGRTIIGLQSPSGGSVHYRRRRIDELSRAQMLPYRKKMQMIFQNPYASLNPRRTVHAALLEPVQFHFPQWSAQERRDKVNEVMHSVGADPAWGARYPHEFSGGQRQRISIARALMVDPEFIIADEPVSALDVSVQAQVLNVLMAARQQRNLTYLFITHDLSVVRHFGTRVAVMYLGRICEIGDAAELFANPAHPYTRALLSAAPSLARGAKKSAPIKLEGEVPTPLNLPSGCVFHPRCQYANQQCRTVAPALTALDNGVQAACHALADKRI